MDDITFTSLQNATLFGDALLKIIEILPFSAHLRDIKTGKYFLANHFQAKNHGCEKIEQVLDINYSDIHQIRREKIAQLNGALVLEDEYKNFIDKANYRSEQEKGPFKFKDICLCPTGFIYIGILRKIPILGEKKKAVAMFTCSEEITRQTDLFDLYYLYKKHYPKRLAIQHFLTYLTLDSYFTTLPTDGEVLTILSIYRDSVHKAAANLLHISPKTIESHLKNIKVKLQKQIDLQTVVMKLRIAQTI